MRELEELLAEYNAQRQLPPAELFCHAPFVSLHFGHGGTALTCCHNRTYVLGTYPESSVAEIWHGRRASELRQALGRNDLSKGCQLCLRQLVARDFVGLADMAGSYRDAAFSEEWQRARGAGTSTYRPGPTKLEFELHNTCNLECVMCHGVASSRIRSRRDALPRLPSPYDEAFVDQLTPILPGVREAGFTGGEPFLIPIYYKIWERIAACSPKTVIMIVTNGTVLGDRARRVVENTLSLVTVSVDSIVKETYESIRKGASLDKVLANCEYYKSLMHERGFPFIWRCCVMRQNWRELPEMVRYCNDHETGLVFNQVDGPLGFSLHTLPRAELAEIVRVLKNADIGESGSSMAEFNLRQYRGLIARLEGFAEVETWRNAFLYRHDVYERLSGQNVHLVSGSAFSSLAEKLAAYTAARINAEEALVHVGGDRVPESVRDMVSTLYEELRALQARTEVGDFARVLLNVVSRTYVTVSGLPPGHTGALFDRIEPLVHLLAEHAKRNLLANTLLRRRPATVYGLLLADAHVALDSLLDEAGPAGIVQ